MEVHLTWIPEGGSKTVETVELLREEQDVFLHGGIPTGLTVERLINDSGFVLFEDQQGIFGVRPDQIISIDPVDA